MTSIFSKQNLSRFKWRGLKSIWKNQDGVSAVEFAIIVPFLFLLYLGGAGLSLMLQADRRVTTVTATIGDLTSRTTVLTTSDVSDIFLAADQLLLPLDPDLAGLRVSSLVSDSSGEVTVAWSDACGPTEQAPDGTSSATIAPLPAGSVFTSLPSGILQPDGSIILSEVIYPYESEVGTVGLMFDGELSDRFYLRPRRTEEIIRDSTTGSQRNRSAHHAIKNPTSFFSDSGFLLDVRGSYLPSRQE